jgi:hypothetical protein
MRRVGVIGWLFLAVAVAGLWIRFARLQDAERSRDQRHEYSERREHRMLPLVPR